MKHLLPLLLVGTLVLISCSEEPMKPESKNTDFILEEAGNLNDLDMSLEAIIGISLSELEAMAVNKQAGQMEKSGTSSTQNSVNLSLTLFDFEDLHGGAHQMYFHNPYHGMMFAQRIFHWDAVWYGNPHSGTKFLYNGWGFDQEYVTFDSPDNVAGVWVGKPHPGSKTFWMEGYLGGTLVGQSSVITLDFAMQWLPANFGGQVDKIVFRINEPGVEQTWWVIDDITFGGPAPGPGPPANDPPIANAGTGQTVEHSGGSASVTLDGSNSSDPNSDPLTYEWTEGGSPLASGVSPTVSLALGSHTITLTVDDGNGGTDTDDVVVEVVNTPPVANAGTAQTIECEGHSSANVTLDGSGSSDFSGDPLTYEWSEGGSPIASGVSPTLSLGLGTHTITLTVDDGYGGTDSDEVVITVEDTQAPTVNMTVELSMLWPPNHTMHLVASGISASDTCCDEVDLAVEVSSNEPESGTGDGDTDSDWEVVENEDGSFDVYVRAERAGSGSGRVYTITATATDCAGNQTVSNGTVNVPNSSGKGKGKK